MQKAFIKHVILQLQNTPEHFQKTFNVLHAVVWISSVLVDEHKCFQKTGFNFIFKENNVFIFVSNAKLSKISELIKRIRS